MSKNRQDFLRHLEESRRNVEQWPSWKQEALKASSKNSSGVVQTQAAQPKR